MLFGAAVHQGRALFAKTIHGRGWAGAAAQQAFQGGELVCFDARQRGLGIVLALARHLRKHPIDRAYMEVHMSVQAGARAVDVDLGFCQSDCANVQRRLVNLGRTGRRGKT